MAGGKWAELARGIREGVGLYDGCHGSVVLGVFGAYCKVLDGAFGAFLTLLLAGLCVLSSILIDLFTLTSLEAPSFFDLVALHPIDR